MTCLTDKMMEDVKEYALPSEDTFSLFQRLGLGSPCYRISSSPKQTLNPKEAYIQPKTGCFADVSLHTA